VECSQRIITNLTLHNHPKAGLPVKYFIATDSDHVIDDIVKKLKEKLPNQEPILIKTDDNDGPLMHFDRSSSAERNAGFIRTLLDIWMLMYTDDLLITLPSNFGRIASFGRDKLPVGLYYTESKNVDCPRVIPKLLLYKENGVF